MTASYGYDEPTQKKFGGAFQMAQRNGYKGSFAEYVELQHQCYEKICLRCGAAPMNFAQWIYEQTKELGAHKNTGAANARKAPRKLHGLGMGR